MDVTIWATLDEQAAAPRGSLLEHWFRTAIDYFFCDQAKDDSRSYVLVTESISGQREVRFKGVQNNWPALADELRRQPFYAQAGFHEPAEGEGEWVDDIGRVGGQHEGRRGSHTGLTVALKAGAGIADPKGCTLFVDFLAAALDDANPVFARVDFLNFHDTTDLEAALRRSQRKSLREARTHLRGYSWVTVVPSELATRLGGVSRLAETGVFHAVRELRGGGLLLQATETLAAYDGLAMRRVFQVLAPVLPSGIPGDDPARPNLRIVFEDASGV
ncbi:hypothetical protein ACN2WE_37900 [Streptomyces sp. cg28]|uniref:hypothetical protein n=1 Tax=Streptomyces sp. cg28 TaxID=3403457 RepID=UPI003B218F14